MSAQQLPSTRTEHSIVVSSLSDCVHQSSPILYTLGRYHHIHPIVSSNIIQICVQSGEAKCRHAERYSRASAHFHDPE